MSGRAREGAAGGGPGERQGGERAGRPDGWPGGGPAGRRPEAWSGGATVGGTDGMPEGGSVGGPGAGARQAGHPEPWPVETPAKPPHLMNPVALAYVGDAVFELLVRQHLAARPNHKPDELHRGAIRYVSAKAQREMLDRLQPHLTEEEAGIVRRGRNAKSGSPPKGADMRDYRHATALECLFGWLYYAGRFGRMAELLRLADGEGTAPDGAGGDADATRKEGDR